MSLSKRRPSFTVTTASDKLTLDDSGAARAPFTVTNTSPKALRGQLVPRPLGAAKPEWFTVAGDAVRDFAPNEAQQIVVQLQVPRDATPGAYSFRLDAVSEDDPDEDFTQGPSVAFDVTAPPPPKKKFPWWILAIVGAILLLVAIGVVIWLLVRDTGPETAPVPRVVGEPRSVAQNRLTDAGFRVNVQLVRISDTAQNGIVQSQDPAGGTIQPLNTEVTINVGRLPRVPTVTGLTQAEAVTRIAAEDLRSTVREVGVEDPQQDGIVQSQDPAGGTLQPPGTVVRIDVGRNVLVPGVVGDQLDVALDKIATAGLRPRVIQVFGPPEIVVDQSPGEGTRLPLGGLVTIHVGRIF